MDLSLPGLNGIEATSEIVRLFPDIRVVVLSMYDDDQSVVGAIRAGARGFVLKQASLSELIEGLHTIAKGGSYLSPQVSDRLLARIQRGNVDSSPVSPVIAGLTPRELQVLRMVAGGKTSKEIAEALDLGVQTVRSYRKTMMKKLGVNNIASLTHLALAAGLTTNLTPSSK
jgi:DNA-binding NarL/FixJ family response regulator